MSDLNLRQIEELLVPLREAANWSPPREGWIKAIRTALGMQTRQLAARLGQTPSAISQLERRETSRSVTLEALTKAADAMNCDLVYALIPRSSLSTMREQQALATAVTILESVSYSMRLESQSVEPEKTARMAREMAEDLLRSWSSKIWEPSAP